MRATKTAPQNAMILASRLTLLGLDWIQNADGLATALLRGSVFTIPLPRSRSRVVTLSARFMDASLSTAGRVFIAVDAPLTDSDAATAYFVARAYASGTCRALKEPRLVGHGFTFHKTLIAAQHAQCGGWATWMNGYDTPSTRSRLSAYTGVPFRQEKGEQYVNKTPIDSHRVWVYPAGIPWCMPQYNNPSDWLYDRALKDEEYQYAA